MYISGVKFRGGNSLDHYFFPESQTRDISKDPVKLQIVFAF